MKTRGTHSRQRRRNRRPSQPGTDPGAPQPEGAGIPLASPFAAREARLLVQIKAAAKGVFTGLPEEPRRWINQLFFLAFWPEPLPGVPRWAHKAARRFFGVTEDDLQAAREAAKGKSLAEVEREFVAELEAHPAFLGLFLGLAFRAVDDFTESAAETVARRRLERLTGILQATKRLELDKVAQQGTENEAQFLTCLGAGQATDSLQALGESNGYRDFDGVVAIYQQQVRNLSSRAEFQALLVSVLGEGAGLSEKRIEHYCRIIDLRFRRPGRPKGSKNTPH